MIERHEDDLVVERQRDPLDVKHLDEIRYRLLHLSGYYRGIQDVIDAYMRQQPWE